MQPLNLIDHLFLFLENDTQPMNISGICVFELPCGADNGFVDSLATKMAAATTLPTPPFNQILTKRLFWKQCTQFDINQHFYHIKLDNASLNEALESKKRKLSYKEQRELASLPDEISKLEEEQTDLQAKLADGSWFITDIDQATKASERLAQIDEILLDKLEHWEWLDSNGQ